VEGRRKNESEPSIRFLSRPWATRFVNKATFGDLAVNWSVALRKTDSGVEGRLTFLGHNPVWLVWKADSAVGKNKICLLPLVFRGTREAAIATTAKCRAAELQVPCG